MSSSIEVSSWSEEDVRLYLISRCYAGESFAFYMPEVSPAALKRSADPEMRKINVLGMMDERAQEIDKQYGNREQTPVARGNLEVSDAVKKIISQTRIFNVHDAIQEIRAYLAGVIGRDPYIQLEDAP